MGEIDTDNHKCYPIKSVKIRYIYTDTKGNINNTIKNNIILDNANLLTTNELDKFINFGRTHKNLKYYILNIALFNYNDKCITHTDDGIDNLTNIPINTNKRYDMLFKPNIKEYNELIEIIIIFTEYVHIIHSTEKKQNKTIKNIHKILPLTTNNVKKHNKTIKQLNK
jgi:hypothetical protein